MRPKPLHVFFSHWWRPSFQIWTHLQTSPKTTSPRSHPGPQQDFEFGSGGATLCLLGLGARLGSGQMEPRQGRDGVLRAKGLVKTFRGRGASGTSSNRSSILQQVSLFEGSWAPTGRTIGDLLEDTAKKSPQKIEVQ